MIGVKTIHLDFAEIQVHEHYVISTIREGVTFGKRHLDTLFEIFSTYYKNRPFISIANRKYDYAIDPNLLSGNKHPDLLGIAVVYYKETTKEIAAFEQKFYTGEFELFNSLEKAKMWSLDLLEAHLKKAGL